MAVKIGETTLSGSAYCSVNYMCSYQWYKPSFAQDPIRWLAGWQDGEASASCGLPVVGGIGCSVSARFSEWPYHFMDIVISYPGGSQSVQIPYYLDDEPISISGSASCSIEVSVPVEIWAEASGPSYQYSKPIWWPYLGKNPGGLPPLYGEVWYQAAGPATVIYNWEAGEAHHNGTYIWNPGAGRSFGSGQTGSASISGDNYCLVNLEPGHSDEPAPEGWSTERSIGSCSFSGSGSEGGTLSSSNGHMTWSSSGSLNVVAGYSAYPYSNVVSASGGCSKGCADGATNISIATKNWDGTDNGSGSIEKQVSHTGSYGAYFTGAESVSGGEAWYVHEIPGEYSGGFLLDAYDLGLHNSLRGRGAPIYPFGTGEDGQRGWDIQQYGLQPTEHSDEDIKIEFPELSDSDVVRFDVPMTKKVSDFLATDLWSINTGSATIEDAGDGCIKITPGTSGASLSSTAYTSCPLRGARYADVVFESDDTEPIEIEIAGRRYSIRPNDGTNSNLWIELVKSTDAQTVDSTQSAFERSINEQGLTWGWGIEKAGTIKLLGLRAGKHYSLKRVDLKRKSESFEVDIFRDPYVDDAPWAMREGDPYSMFMVDGQNYRGLTGVVRVDGVVAAEIIGMMYSYNEIEDVWLHPAISLDEGFMHPSPLMGGYAGLVTYELLKSIDERHLVPFLPVGKHVIEGESWTAGTHCYVRSIRRPFERSKSASGVKHFEGQAAMLIVGNKGQSLPAKLETYLLDTEGDPISSEDITIPASGILELPSKKQSYMRYGSVVSGSGATWTVDGINDRDYTGHTLYCIDPSRDMPQCTQILAHNPATGHITINPDDYPSGVYAGQEVSVHLPLYYKLKIGDRSVTFQMRNRVMPFATLLVTPTGTIQLDHRHNRLTGVGALAVSNGAKVSVFQTYDFGKTYATEQVLEEGDVKNPCVYDVPDGRGIRGVAWTSGSDTKVALSQDGFTSKEVSTLFSGLKNARIVAHPGSGVIVAVGLNVDNNLVAYRSYDAGWTFQGPYTVALGIPDQTPALDSVQDAHGSWRLVWQDASGNNLQYYSLDNGEYWQALS